MSTETTTELQVEPGATIKVSIVKTPTNISARKTLVRLLLKDEGHKREKNILSNVKAKYSVPIARGGRLWGGIRPKIHRLHGKKGEEGTIFASTDVVRDLKRVAPFVKIETV